MSATLRADLKAVNTISGPGTPAVQYLRANFSLTRPNGW